ncbi:MAG: STAS domain-containing protein [Actinomycetota bacterium]|nr:STAS domain-containing protein [Actinomycetota bacterium]
MLQEHPALEIDAAHEPNAYVSNGPLQIRSERWPSAYVVSVSGELDFATSGCFDEELQKARRTDAPRIILDLCALQFIDSAGLRVLVQAEIASREESQGLFLTRGAHQVERMLEITGVRKKFRFLD